MLLVTEILMSHAEAVFPPEEQAHVIDWCSRPGRSKCRNPHCWCGTAARTGLCMSLLLSMVMWPSEPMTTVLVGSPSCPGRPQTEQGTGQAALAMWTKESSKCKASFLFSSSPPPAPGWAASNTPRSVHLLGCCPGWAGLYGPDTAQPLWSSQQPGTVAASDPLHSCASLSSAPTYSF